MSIFAKIVASLSDAFWTNWRFLSEGFGEPPAERSFVAMELRELVERDLPILIHKRNKWIEREDEQRWLADLEAFVARSLRPKLAGESLLALWNDSALMRSLDALVVREQQLVAVKVRSESLPVTSRFDSPWAN